MIFSNISRVSKDKGISWFLDCVGSIDNRSLKIDKLIKFELAGSDSGSDYEKYIAEKSKAISGLTYVGQVNNVSEYLENIDCIIFTSLVPDSLPTVLIEAMAKGKMIIATDVGGVKEIVPSDVGNIIISPGNSRELIEAIVKVINLTEEDVTKQKKKNIEIAKSKFSIERQANQYLKLFQELI